MSLPNFEVRDEYIGTGLLSAYTFGFTISQLANILVIITDASFNPICSVRGTDTTFLTSVTFDPINGGGTVNLVTALGLNYNLTLLLANDAPVQPCEFRGKSDFTLRNFESALDIQAGAIQRLAYLASKSVKISDNLTAELPFNTQIPINSTSIGVQDNRHCVIAIGVDNASFEIGPSTVSLAAWAAEAIASAAAAAVSQTAAAASASAALASQNLCATYSSNASTQATAAANSATLAASYASNAAVSASTASTAEAGAITAASSATTSATNAAASASSASINASSASASAASATTSATNAANSASAAAASATSAAASAAAAAVSAAGAPITVIGTRSIPTNVVAANGILFSSTTNNTVNFIQGSGGAVIISAALQIQAGSYVGQRLTLIGRTDAKSVTLNDGNGIATGGLTLTLIANSIVTFIWDGSFWVIEEANGLM